MNEPPNGKDLTSALDHVMQEAKEAADKQDPTDTEPVEVEALNGEVKVEADPAGKISITLAPRAVRQGSELLSEALTQAVNQALSELREKSGSDEEPVDLQGLSENLQDLQRQSAEQMQSFFTALIDNHQRMGRGGGK